MELQQYKDKRIIAFLSQTQNTSLFLPFGVLTKAICGTEKEKKYGESKNLTLCAS
jgi:hypothetical protein